MEEGLKEMVSPIISTFYPRSGHETISLHTVSVFVFGVFVFVSKTVSKVIVTPIIPTFLLSQSMRCFLSILYLY